MEFRFTDEQKAFKDQVLKFSQKELAPLAEEADWKGEFCWEAWRKMGGFGLLEMRTRSLSLEDVFLRLVTEEEGA